MKKQFKFLCLILIFMTLSVLQLISCASSRHVGPVNVWVDDNTFRITASGLPDKKAATDMKKKSSAKLNSVFNARNTAWDEFTGKIIDSGNGMCEESERNEGIEIRKIINNGKVISEKFEKDFKCEIVYEVKYEGLKKRVELLHICNVRGLF